MTAIAERLRTSEEFLSGFDNTLLVMRTIEEGRFIFQDEASGCLYPAEPDELPIGIAARTLQRFEFVTFNPIRDTADIRVNGKAKIT